MINMHGKAPFATLAYLKRNIQVDMREVFRYRPDELWDEEFISHFKKLINDNPGYIKMICLNESVKKSRFTIENIGMKAYMHINKDKPLKKITDELHEFFQKDFDPCVLAIMIRALDASTDNDEILNIVEASNAVYTEEYPKSLMYDYIFKYQQVSDEFIDKYKDRANICYRPNMIDGGIESHQIEEDSKCINIVSYNDVSYNDFLCFHTADEVDAAVYRAMQVED